MSFKTHISQIDGLRFLAVLSVVLYHLDEKYIPNGFLGVDIFFVISGYVISISLAKNIKNNLKSFLLNFYKRRIKRLFPALLFFVFIIFICFTIIDPNPKKDFSTGILSLVGLSNLYLLFDLNNYFSISNIFNPFTHTWSLGVEEQFYFLYPFIFWLIFKNKKFLFLIFILTALSLVSWLLLSDYQNIQFYSPVTRLWEIGFGCVTYNLRHLKFKSYFQYLFFVCIILCLLIDVQNSNLEYLIIVIATSLFLISIKNKTIISRFLSKNSIVYLGKISYSTYLWHWGILSIAHWTSGVTLFTIPFILALTFFMSIISYEFIEIPFRKNSSIIKDKKIIFITMPIIIICFIMFSNINESIYLGDLNYYLNNKTSYPPNNEYATLKKNNSNKNILLIGDSHAGHLYDAVNLISKKLNYSYYIHPRGKGLPFKVESDNNSYYNFLVEPFEYYYNKLNKNDFVIISVDYRFEKIENEIILAYNKIIDKNEDKFNLIIIDQTPYVTNKTRNLNNLLCEKTIFRPNVDINKCFSKISKEELLSKKKETTKYLLMISDSKKVHYFDPFNILCPEETCYNHKNDQFIYSDSDHLTKYGSLLLSDELEKYIVNVGNKYSNKSF